MLVLLFETAEGRYAIETRHLVEVVPFVSLKRMPKAGEAVAGLANYRGRPVPVLDLSVLLAGSASEPLISTRILIVQDPFVAAEPAALLGLIAPGAMATFRSRAGGAHGGVLMDEELYNGTVASDSKGMVQLLDLRKLLPEQELAELRQATA